MSEHYYDGQIRRYLVQIMRLFSSFSYKTGKGQLVQVPVMYGDMTRQVANILRDNSENKIPSAPRISVYITGLEIDRDRTSDPSFVSKKHIRERAYDDDGKEYLNYQGKNYTIERLMPTPYKLTLNIDIWSTGVDQKLQILEQILMLFNPSLEIQTNNNYLDWTSLSVVNLENVNFSNRSLPTGTETEIDIAQLQFSTPIYISPPAKVKRLGVITSIITSVLSSSNYVDFEKQLEGTELFPISNMSSIYTANNEPDTVDQGAFANQGTGEIDLTAHLTRQKLDIDAGPYHQRLLVNQGNAQLLSNGVISQQSWLALFQEIPGKFVPGITAIYLRKPGLPGTIVGTVEINPTDDTKLVIEFDKDSLPANDLIPSASRSSNQLTSIDYIIDPLRFDPRTVNFVGARLLVLSDIGNVDNLDGADAWKNTNGSDFVARANDIVEWSGTAWTIVFDAAQGLLTVSNEIVDTLHTTNLNTGTQYYWSQQGWLLSVDGEYSKDDWNIILTN